MYENNIKKSVIEAENIVVTAHTNPDGDAVGSALAIAMAVRSMGKTPVVVLEKLGEEFELLEGRDMLYTGDVKELECDLLIAVDCGNVQRLCCGEELLKRAKVSYNLDHHISNENYADFNIVNGSASSACEVVYECINDAVEIDKAIATALYCGILTDTGCFRHNCTSRRTHEIAGVLVEKGVDTAYLHYKLLMEHTIAQGRVLARAIDNVVTDSGITYSMLTSDEISASGAQAGDLGGIIDYLLNIKGTRVAMLATERGEDIVKLSLRSRDVDVNAVAAVFGGGGHILAAGATVNGCGIKAVVDKAVLEIKNRL
jgi:phosphoesterase RecJ-like protein